jgi:AraC-like DNA-binding protein
VADDLAARMDYGSGHVRYCLDDMAARLGISKASIKRHVGYLRELGALAWVQHGTRANVRRLLGRKGYAATATVYAAVIPAVYDHAMGHRIIGSGYTARIIIDLRNRPTVPAQAAGPVDNPPVDNSTSPGLEPPSRMRVKGEGQVQVVGGEGTSTAQARAAAPVTRPKKKHTITGYAITAERIDRARRLAKTVRPQVNWIQRATHDQLSWVLLDLVAKDWAEPQIVLWLNRLGLEVDARRWRPRFPHRVIAAALLGTDRADKQRTDTQGATYEDDLRHAAAPTEEFRAVARALREEVPETWAEYPDLDQVPSQTWEKVNLQEAATQDPALILSFAQHAGREEAIRVFGTKAAAALDWELERQAAGFGTIVS